jgi:hypothetical protein
MGDHRADIKIEFSMYGKTENAEFWINWFPEHNGVDRRITEWFKEQAEAFRSEWEAQLTREALASRRKQMSDDEYHERKMLAELKAKYEDEP